MLIDGHVGGVFVRVAVKSDLVAGITDHGTLFGEGLETVPWDEPGGFDAVFLEEFEEAGCADMAGPETCNKQ